MSTRQGIVLAPDLTLPVDAVTSSFAVTGKKRTGKSNTSVVFCEGLYAAQLPFVVLDPKGDWWGMRAGADGDPAGGLPIPIFGGEHADFPLSPDAGDYMARLVVDRNLTAILDVSDFRPSELRRFVKDFLTTLYRQNKTPRMVVLEEAQEIAPQVKQRGIGTDGDLEMVAAVKRFVKLGGFKGLGTTLVTQRFADVDKGVTTQVETIVVHRTTGPQDKKAIRDWVDGAAEGAELVAGLDKLDNGEAWVWSPHFLGQTVRVRMRRRATFDSGATPKVGEPAPVATLADLHDERIEEAMAAAIDQAQQNDPRHLRRELTEARQRIRELEAKLAEQPEPVAPEPQVVHLVDDFSRNLMGDLIETLREALERDTGQPAAVAHVAPRPFIAPPPAREELEATPQVKAALDRHAAGLTPAPKPSPTRDAAPADAKVKGVARDVLSALATHGVLSRESLGVFVGKSSKGGYFQRVLAGLRDNGWIEGHQSALAITDAGRHVLGHVDPLPEGRELVEWWVNKLGGRGVVAADVLLAVLEASPTVLTKEQIGQAIGKSHEGGYFQRTIAKLRGLGLLNGFEAARDLQEAWWK